MMQRRPIAVTTQPRKKPIWSFYTRLYQIYIYIQIHICMLHSIIRISPSFSRFFSWRRSVVTTSVHCTLLTKTNGPSHQFERRFGSSVRTILTAPESSPAVTKKKVKKNASQHLRGPFWIIGKKRKWVVELQINVFLCSPPKITDGSNLTRIFCRMGWNHQVAKCEKEEQKFPRQETPSSAAHRAAMAGLTVPRGLADSTNSLGFLGFGEYMIISYATTFGPAKLWTMKVFKGPKLWEIHLLRMKETVFFFRWFARHEMEICVTN